VKPAAFEYHRPETAAEAAGLLAELEAIVATARPVPLVRQVRVEQDRMYDVLDRLRGLLPPYR
jgi:hypothetical protein